MTSFLLIIFTYKYYTVYELMNKLNMTIILYMYTYMLLSHVFDPHLDKGTSREYIVHMYMYIPVLIISIYTCIGY